MLRRILITLLALLVAAVGGVLTFLYASNADARAMARMDPVQVLVVAEPIAAGTPAEEIARSVSVAELPSAAIVPGSVSDLSDLAGLQAAADLQPGEQLLTARFVAPEAVPDEVQVPEDMQLISIQLNAQRVVGGELDPGDTVAVFISASVKEDGATEPVQLTRLVHHKVLVTAVVGGSTVTVEENGEEVEEPAQDTLTVTLALGAAEAEELVWGQEFGTVWLSLEGAEVPEDEGDLVDAGVIFQ